MPAMIPSDDSPDSLQSQGGKARAAKLSKEKLKEIATKAAAARWSLPKVICGAPDHPLRIGDIEIPCYVLEGEKRVLVQRAIVSAMGMSRGSSSKGGGDRLAHFVHQERLEPFISGDLKLVTDSPIKFITPSGSVAHGYEAEYLAKLCFAVLDAERAGALQDQQKHIAKQCRLLIEGFSIVGINALVDEATGYQQIRAKDALAKILEQFISKELRAWTRTFPIEFYEEIFRLHKWVFDPTNLKRPSVIGHYTNDFIYSRLAPGVLPELREKNPVIDGRRKHKHFMWLTGDVGDPRLRALIDGMIRLMRGSSTWEEFKGYANKFYPRLKKTELGFDVEDYSKEELENIKATPALA